MADLREKVAVVTGATRGLGRGIAVGLGEAGATVYVTGRSTTDAPGALPGTVEETAAEVTQAGGRGVAVRCDHRVDADVAALFDRVRQENDRLDLLVNNAFASPEQRILWGGQSFWEIPIELWDDITAVGLRSHFVATRYAVPMLIENRGLVVNVASHAAGRGKSEQSRAILPYSVCKAGLRRLSSDMAAELRRSGVAVFEVWPPASRTEGVLAESDVHENVENWKQPVFTGRVIAELAARPIDMARSGEPLVVDELAEQFGIDGSG